MSSNFVAEVRNSIKDLPEDELRKLAGDGNCRDHVAEVSSPLDALVKNDSPEKVEAALRKLMPTLAGVDPLRRATEREGTIKKLEKIGVSAPARLIDAALQTFQVENDGMSSQGRPVLFDDPEPWPEVVNGSVLLNDIATACERFIVFPPHAAEATALWILHACALEAFMISPILAVTSPTKRSGKTLLLEVISYLLVKRLFASNVTPATLFRAVDKYTPSLLIDEADTFLRDNDELRGILNASHRKATAIVIRTVGDEHEPVFFVTWCPKAIALVGKLPGTLEDRSILISMKRKDAGERVERFRPDKISPKLKALKRRIMRWVADNLDRLRQADPETPSELNDRAKDNWGPLLAVAELVGGEWRGKAQAAARALSGAVSEGANSAPIQLLADLSALFDERDTDRLLSADICEALATMEDRPWPEWKKQKPITPRQLARLLNGFDVLPKTIRAEVGRAKGYEISQFRDAFSRYGPFTPPQSVTTGQPAPSADLRGNSIRDEKSHVTDENVPQTASNKPCHAVTDEKGVFPGSEGGVEKPQHRGLVDESGSEKKWMLDI